MVVNDFPLPADLLEHQAHRASYLHFLVTRLHGENRGRECQRVAGAKRDNVDGTGRDLVLAFSASNRVGGRTDGIPPTGDLTVANRSDPGFAAVHLDERSRVGLVDGIHVSADSLLNLRSDIR